MNIPTHRHFSGPKVKVTSFLSVSPFIARMIFRGFILSFQLLIALAMPFDFGYIQAIVGSVAIGLGTFVLPPIMYWYFKREEISIKAVGKGKSIAIYSVIIMLLSFGCLLLFAGSTVAIINIVNSISTFSLFNGF